MRKHILRCLFALVLVFVSDVVAQAQFTQGNLVVVKAEGSSSAATPITLCEYTTAGSLVDTVAIPSTTSGGRILQSGSASSEGYLSLSAEQDRIIVVGYDAPSGTSSITGSSSATYNRAIGQVDHAGSFLFKYEQSVFSANNIRGGTAYGSNYFATGANTGVILMNSGSTLSSSSTNNDGIGIINGNVYFLTQKTTVGLWQMGSGISTSTGQTSTNIATNSTDVASCTAFAISPDGNTLYVADGSKGIIKFTRTGGTGSFTEASYKVYNTACGGIAVDFTTSGPTIYATTADFKYLIKLVDNGTANTSSESSLAIASTSTSYPFKGVTFAPYQSVSMSALATSVCSGSSSGIVFSGNPYGVISYNINGGSTLTTTLNPIGADTLSTGSLTANATYNMVSYATPTGSVSESATATITVISSPASITGNTSICLGTPGTLSDGTTGGTWTSSNTGIATVGTGTGLVSGVTTGTANITYTIACGSAVVNVTVNPLPSSVTGTASFCQGATTTLSDVTGSGAWSSSNTAVGTVDGSGHVYGVGSGTATISYTLATGCYGVYTVSVNPAVPPAGTISGTTALNNGGTVTLSETLGTGTWSSGNIAVATIGTTGIVSGVAPGTVVITYAVSNACGTGYAAYPITVYNNQFSPGNLSVLMIGDGSTTLSSNAAPLSIVEYTTSGAVTGTGVSLPSSGSPQITNSGTASSEGNISLSAENDRIAIAGYDASAGTASVTSSTSSSVNREVFTISSAGAYSKAAYSTTAFSGNNVRGATASGSNYFAVGPVSSSDVVLMNSSTQISTVNSRGIEIFNGQAYLSSNTSPNSGINSLGTGIPTTSGQTATLLTPVIGNPYAFSISPDGNTLYVADGTAGVLKYSFSSGSFGFTYTVNATPARGLTVDFSGSSPVIYATDVVGDSIFKITDIGASSAQTTVANAPANNFFRGLTFSPKCYAAVTPLTSPTVCNGSATAIVINGNPTGVVSYNINGGATMTTTIGVNGADTLSTAALTENTTYHLLSIATTACSSSPLTGSLTLSVVPSIIAGTPTVCAGSSVSLTDTVSGGTWSSANTSVANVGSLNGVVSGVAQGTATISYVASGCTITSIVTVNATPAIITGTLGICLNLNSSLSDVTGGGNWSSSATAVGTVDNSGNVGAISAGTTTITYTLTDGCYATAAVTVNALPVISSISTNSPVCAGATLTLNASATGAGTINYAWTGPVAITGSSSASATVPLSTTGASGTYTVLATDANSCSNMATTSATVNPDPSLTSANNDGPICAGATLNLSVSGASNVTGYSWSGPVSITGATSASASVPSATTAASGIYTVTVNNGAGTGCTATYTTSATVNPDPSLTSANNDGPICAGTTLNLTVTGASNVTGYSWSGPVSITSATSASASVPSATTAASGIYTVTVNNGAGTGCTATYTTSATVNPDPSLTSANNDGPICAGTTLNLTVTGASNVTGYSWSGPVSITSATSASASVPSATTAASGVYTVTVNNGTGTGCTATYTTSATVNPDPSLTSANNDGPICAGTTLNLTVTGASNVTGYSWSGPVSITSATSASASVPSATTAASGVYTVTVNNGTGTGCTATYTTSATVNPDPSLTSANNDGPICAGTTLNLTVSGASNVTGYSWSGPVSITSATSASASVPTATTAASGIYTVTVNNGTGTGCTAMYTTSATVNPDPSLTSANNDGPICAGTTLNLTVSGASNVTGYSWSGPVSITSATSASASVPSATTAASGVYTVTVNNGTGTGCTATYTTSATVNPDPSLTSANNDGPICAGTTLNLTVSGASNVTGYSWSGPVSITSATSASASVPSATTAASGIYTVTVNNGTGTGCTATYTTSATVNPDPSLTSANNDGPICAGTTLNLTVTGASNVTGYSWSGPVSITSATSASASVPSATTAASGVYTVTVNNGTGTGCTATYTTSATVNPDPSLTSANNSGPICAGTTLNLTVTGASNVTGYSWSGPVSITSATSASASVPSATTAASGIYTVTVNNGTGTGCTATYTTSATVNPYPSLTSANNDGPICAGTTLNLTVSGASNVTGYSWSGPVSITSATSASASVPSATTAASGIYTVTVNNGTGTGCTAMYTTSATVNPDPSLTSANNDGPICAGTTLNLTVSGASNVTGYSWSGPVSITSATSASASVPSATTAASGIYTVTVNNGTGTGCTATYTTSATVNPDPSLTSANNSGPICAGTTLNLTVTGASNVTGYSWSGPVSITSATSASASVPSATTAASGVYTVTVNNGTGTGCTAMYTTSATVNPDPSLTSANNDGPICAGTTLNLTVTGASNVTGYSWSGPVSITSATSASASVPSATTAASGVYTVTVNNGTGTGCTAMYTTSATVNPDPSLTSANNDGPICAGTTLNLTVTGASNVTGYSWSGPVSITSATSASASVPSATTAASGVYTVTVNNGTGTGCTATYTTSATVNPDPSLTSANNDGPICAGTTLNLTVSGASNVTGYSWSGPVSITSATSASASVPTATTAASGIYTVTVNNGTGTGCTAMYTTSATVNPDPSLTSANNDGPICAGTTLNLTVSGASNVTGYSWSGPVSITSATSASASVPSATTAASGVYTVTVNNGTGTGCTATYTTSATVNPDPSLTSANNDGPICAGTTLNLTVSGASNVTGYSWSGPVSITSATSASASVPAATTAASGIYTVTVNNGTGTGCTATYTTSATVNPDPSLTSANNDGPICAGTTLNLTVTGASNVTGYSWSGPVSITSATSASASVPTATTAASGIYTVTVNNGTGTGCTTMYTTSATVNSDPSLTSANNDGPICAGTTLNLTVTGASNVTGYSWSGPVSITSATSASASVPSATTAASGIYTVTVNNGTGTGCTATYTTSATVNPYPSLTSANNDGPICAGTTLNLTVSGASNVTGYSWSGPVSITSATSASASVPSATTAASGIYTVTVNNGTGTGCTAMYTTSATVNPDPSLTSANNDGPICAGTTLNLTVSGASNVTGYSWSGPVSITSATSASASVPSATTAASGIYTVTVNNGTGTGCTATYTTSATVNPDPSLTSANNSGPICAGTTLNLTVTGASNVTGYSWSGPVSITSATSASASVPSATTAASGVYTVTVNNGTGTGCTAMYTTSATVNPDPSLTSANNDGPICAGTTLNLTVTGASNVTGYSWSGPVSITSATSASASVPSATTAASGVYTVTVNNGTGTGCTATYTTSATVNPDPSLTSANNDGPICAGTTLNLTVTGASNVTGYSWSGPVSITSATSASASVPTATTAASGIYTVTVNNGTGTGCTTMYTTSATVNSDPSLTSANNDGPICAGTTLNLTVTGASNVTGYSWSGPVSITSATSASASVPSATTAASGIYTVTVNNGTGTGCTAMYTTSATVNPAPSLTSANNDGPICAGTTLNLTVSGASNVTGYSWSGPVSITSATSASASVPSATTAASGIYTVTVNNGTGTGCTATYTTSATVNPDPSLSSANNDGPICAGTTLNLTVSGASNVTGYSWSGPVSITSATSASASVPSATTAASGIYTVTVNNGTGTGCTAMYTTSATVNPDPSLTSANNSGPICAGTTLNLTVTGASNVTGYSWSGPVSITSATSASASVPSATTAASGIYTVTVNNGTGTGCTATYTTSATVNPDPSLTSANNDGPICAGTTLNLTVTGASNVTGYSWSGPVSITSATSASASVPSATSAASGVYTVTVNNGTGTGCTATYTTSATVNPDPSLTSANNSGPICAGTTLNLTVTGASNVTGYSWSGPVSITSATSASASVPSATTAASGIYTVTVNNGTGTGCTATYTTSVTINPGPAPIAGTTALCSGATTSTTLTDSTSSGVWTSGNSSVATVGSVSGAVTLVSSGATFITYTIPSGCFTIVSVGSPVISGVNMICTGNSVAFTDANTGGTWSTRNSDATVGASSGIVTGNLSGGDTVYYSVSGCAASYAVTVQPSPAAISASAVGTGVSTTFTDATSGGSWTSSNTSVATVGISTGVVTGEAPGVVVISYSLGTGCASVKSTTVLTAPVIISGSANICVGFSYLLSDTSSGGVWSSSGPAAAVGSNGVVTGELQGTAIISYTLNGFSSTLRVNVLATPALITGGRLCSGKNTTFTDATSGGTWSGSNTSVVTVAASTGVVSSVTSGTAIISYSGADGCPAMLSVTVSPSPAAIIGSSVLCGGMTNIYVDSITGGTWTSSSISASVTGSLSGSVVGELSGTTTLSYTLGTGCYATLPVQVAASPAAITGGYVCVGQTKTFTDATSGGAWSTASSAISSVTSAGVVSGVTMGITNISYVMPSGCSATYPVTVNAMPAAISGVSIVCNSQTYTMTDATSGGSWNTSSTTVSLSSVGILTGVMNGAASISYNLSGCIATRALTVTAMPAAIAGAEVCTGATKSFTDGTTGGTWSSGATGVATVSSSGIVSGITAGTATISYTVATGCAAIYNATVNTTPGAVSGGPIICTGVVSSMTDATPGGTWSSSSTAASIVGSSGAITGELGGVANITYNVAGCYAVKTVSVSVSPGAITGSSTVEASLTTSYGDGTTAGMWSSNTTTVATAGTATSISTTIAGVSLGTAVITFSLPSGCYATKLITVTPYTGRSVDTAVSLCLGGKISLENDIQSLTVSNNEVVSVVANNTITGLSVGEATVSYTVDSSSLVLEHITVTDCGNLQAATNAATPVYRLMPNPNSGYFTVTGATETNDATINISIADMLGRIVYQNVFNVQNGQINAVIQLDNAVANGEYLLTLHNGSAVQVFRFVVTR